MQSKSDDELAVFVTQYEHKIAALRAVQYECKLMALEALESSDWMLGTFAEALANREAWP